MGMTIAGTLPGGDGNGLTAIDSELIRDPRKVHVVIGIVDTMKITVKPDTGEQIPTVRIRRIEVVTDDDRGQAQILIMRALDKRMGHEALPFDLEQDIRAAFTDGEDGDAG